MEAYILSSMIVGVAVFQLLLALGLPYGQAAWGGQHAGVLPANMRVGSGVAALILGFSALVVLSAGGVLVLFPELFSYYFLRFLFGYFAIGVIMNAISRSKTERLWAPYVAVMMWLCLRLMLR